MIQQYSRFFRAPALLLTAGTLVLAVALAQKSAPNTIHVPPFLPQENEPVASIVVNPPLAGPLEQGRVIIQYRAENLRIMPVFGAAATAVSPRIGHIHVTVDDSPWRWADTSGAPIILNGLPAGPHKVLLELANPNHQILNKAVVTFVVPETGKPETGTNNKQSRP